MNNINQITAIKAAEMAFTENVYLDEMGKKFLKIDSKNIDEFKNFIYLMIEKSANMGCNDYEFQTDTNLDTKVPSFRKEIEGLGYKFEFYKLNPTFDKRNFNLIISW